MCLAILMASGRAPCGIFRSVLDESCQPRGDRLFTQQPLPWGRASHNHRNYTFLLNEPCLQANLAEATDNHRRHCANQDGARTERSELVLVSWDLFLLVTLPSHVYMFGQRFLSSSCVQALGEILWFSQGESWSLECIIT